MWCELPVQCRKPSARLRPTPTVPLTQFPLESFSQLLRHFESGTNIQLFLHHFVFSHVSPRFLFLYPLSGTSPCPWWAPEWSTATWESWLWPGWRTWALRWDFVLDWEPPCQLISSEEANRLSQLGCDPNGQRRTNADWRICIRCYDRVRWQIKEPATYS